MDVEALCHFLSRNQCRAQAIMQCYNRARKSSTCVQLPGHQKCDACDPDNVDLAFAQKAFLLPAVRKQSTVLADLEKTPVLRQMHPLTSRTPTAATFERIARDQEQSLRKPPPILSQGTDYSNYGDEEPLSAEILAALDESEVRHRSQSGSCRSLMKLQRMSHQARAPSGSTHALSQQMPWSRTFGQPSTGPWGSQRAAGPSGSQGVTRTSSKPSNPWVCRYSAS